MFVVDYSIATYNNSTITYNNDMILLVATFGIEHLVEYIFNIELLGSGLNTKPGCAYNQNFFS